MYIVYYRCYIYNVSSPFLAPGPNGSVTTKVDASCVIPLKKQQGFLNMFGQMISIVGSKLEPQMAVLFPITLKLGSFCAQLLEQRDQVMN